MAHYLDYYLVEDCHDIRLIECQKESRKLIKRRFKKVKPKIEELHEYEIIENKQSIK